MAQADRLRLAGQHAQALQAYASAVRLAPGLAGAHYGRANSLLESGQPRQAIDAYAQAIALEPGHAAAHFNSGQAHLQLGQHAAALQAYAAALRADATMADAHVALGTVQEDMLQFDQALASYLRALALRPDYAEVHANLGSVHRRQGRLQASLDSYRRAIALSPGYVAAHIGLGNTLMDQGELQQAIASIRQALALEPGLFAAHSNLLFLLHYLPGMNPGELMREALRFGEQAAAQARPTGQWANPRDPSRRLRVGLVSGDFRQHPVGYFLLGVVEHLVACADSRLQLVAYASHLCVGDMADRFRALVPDYHFVGELSDERLAAQVRGDKIDILVDLSGHTAHNRLPMFAWKPAPVQVSWLGYFATTGLREMDGVLADPWSVPAGAEADFCERIVRLDDTRLCLTPPDTAATPSALPALANGYVTFGCFNQLTKLNDPVLTLWAQVLHAVPHSRLFLRAPQLSDAATRAATLARLLALGLAPERLVLEGKVSREDYLASYQHVDMALDPFPYTGGTTTAEALWMGVPTLTLAGTSMLSRQGVSMLMNAGLPQWVAADPADYVAKAVAHAADLPALAATRGRLRQQAAASPLFDAARFAPQLEEALRGMWHAYCMQVNA